MLWVKTFHLLFIISWLACLFYLPRLFVNHATNKEGEKHALLSGMELRLIKMMDTMLVFVLITGVSLIYIMSGGFEKYYFQQAWLHVKLTLVVFLVGYHFYCKRIHKNFINGTVTHSHKWFRVFNELPVFVVVAILYLVIAKPF